MSVRVELKQRHNCYTNFDFVEGRVLLSILQQETIAAITVKLEGESRTRLAGQVPMRGRGQYDGFQNEQTQLEVHKVSTYSRPYHSIGRETDHLCSSSITSKSSFPPRISLKHPRGCNSPCHQGSMNIHSSSRQVCLSTQRSSAGAADECLSFPSTIIAPPTTPCLEVSIQCGWIWHKEPMPM